MCGIAASLDQDRLKELASLNRYRGTGDMSMFAYKPGEALFDIDIKRESEGDLDRLIDQFEPGYLNILHMQTKTSRTAMSQPVMNESGQWLIHNGMMRESGESVHYVGYDSDLLLQSIGNFGLKKALESFNGSFACICTNQDHELQFFRNRSAPLCVDFTNQDIASTSDATPENLIDEGVIYTNYERTSMKFKCMDTDYYIHSETKKS